jgi:hypothetical protein
MMRLERAVLPRLSVPAPSPASTLFSANHRWPVYLRPIPGKESSGRFMPIREISFTRPARNPVGN